MGKASLIFIPSDTSKVAASAWEGSARPKAEMAGLKNVLAAMFAFGPYCGRFAGVPAFGSHEPKAPKLKSQLVQLCHHRG